MTVTAVTVPPRSRVPQNAELPSAMLKLGLDALILRMRLPPAEGRSRRARHRPRPALNGRMCAGDHRGTAIRDQRSAKRGQARE